MTNKEVKSREKKPIDTELGDWDYTVAERNILTLSSQLKAELMGKGLDWRFINAKQFREKGNLHKNQWRPYNVNTSSPFERFSGISPEGVVQRGDLILAVRPKSLSDIYKKNLQEKTRIYQGHQRAKAQELRNLSKEHGVENQVKIHEGYEDN